MRLQVTPWGFPRAGDGGGFERSRPRHRFAHTLNKLHYFFSSQNVSLLRAASATGTAWNHGRTRPRALRVTVDGSNGRRGHAQVHGSRRA